MIDLLLLAANAVALIAAARLAGGLARDYLGLPILAGELLGGLLIAQVPRSWLPHDHPFFLLLGLLGAAALMIEAGLKLDLGTDRKPWWEGLRSGLVQAGGALIGACAVMMPMGYTLRQGLAAGGALGAASLACAARLPETGGDSRARYAAAAGSATLACAAAGGFQALGLALFFTAALATGVMAARFGLSARAEPAARGAAWALAPLYFLLLGARIDLAPLNPFRDAQGTLLLLLLTAAALPRWWAGRGRREASGAPGESGMLIAQAGFDSALLDERRYSVVVVAVVLITLGSPLAAWARGLFVEGDDAKGPV